MANENLRRRQMNEVGGSNKPFKPAMSSQNDIKSLDSSMKLLSQKVSLLINNQNILSRNLIILNKKISTMQKGSLTKEVGTDYKKVEDEINNIHLRMDAFEQKISDVRVSFENDKDSFAKSSDLSEIKYLIETINPIELVSQKQLREVVAELKGEKDEIVEKKEEKVVIKKDDKKKKVEEKKEPKGEKIKDIWDKFGV